MSTYFGEKEKAGKMPPKFKAGDWYCSQCGDLQFARNMFCRMCGAPTTHEIPWTPRDDRLPLPHLQTGRRQRGKKKKKGLEALQMVVGGDRIYTTTRERLGSRHQVQCYPIFPNLATSLLLSPMGPRCTLWGFSVFWLTVLPSLRTQYTPVLLWVFP